ncbi:MAG: alpha-2-macroglobulin, partial [Saprospiraceae bacterium]|nr:alpha-2-macroglobulin [Saprospiraceae bacterium]
MRPVLEYYLEQAQSYWNGRPLYTQALMALALHRWGRPEEVAVMRQSFEERSLMQQDLGRYWKAPAGYHWSEMPIERHALLIEFFVETGAPDTFVDELRLWLLTNKQTNRWQTTKATAAAVYALLMHQDSWLEGVPVRVEVGGQPVIVADPEAGSLYSKQSWPGEEVSGDLAAITVSNPNDHAGWGAAYWQYFEELDAVQAASGTPLTVAKRVFRETMTDSGPRLEALTEGAGVHIGDKLVVRIEIAVDRDMEFIHLKDMRGSGIEPVDVLSGYRWQGGLGYYQSTGDLATHFFFDVLPRGKYVFEYPLRVAHAGRYSNGIATLQSMYAPEFSSHSASVRLTVE